jgi:formate C-acetyltransferase
LLWSERLPEGFKRYATEVSIKSSTIQYENDDLMRTNGVPITTALLAVSQHNQLQRWVQFFGARANLAKAILYAINGGVDEIRKSKLDLLMNRSQSDTSITKNS